MSGRLRRRDLGTAFGLALAALVLTACGYALVGRASNLPEDIGSIYVHPLKNETRRSQVEQILTEAIIDELVKRQRLKVVSRASEADSELIGTVTGFLARPVTFGEEGRGTQYEVIINARMVFQRPGSDEEPIWSTDRYLFRDSYDLDLPDSGGFFDQEDVAIRGVSDIFAQTLITDMFEGF